MIHQTDAWQQVTEFDKVVVLTRTYPVVSAQQTAIVMMAHQTIGPDRWAMKRQIGLIWGPAHHQQAVLTEGKVRQDWHKLQNRWRRARRTSMPVDQIRGFLVLEGLL